MRSIANVTEKIPSTFIRIISHDVEEYSCPHLWSRFARFFFVDARWTQSSSKGSNISYWKRRKRVTCLEEPNVR